MELFKRIVVFLICSTVLVVAQQDPQFSQYMFAPISYNPAYSGVTDNTEVQLIHRSQWLGYKKAPNTQLLGFSTPIKTANSGLGIYIVHDQLGNLTNTFGKVSYAYHLKIKNGKLSFGLGAGLYSLSSDANYIYNDANDPNINTETFSQSKLDLSTGLWYHHEKYYIGLSANHLNFAKFSYNNNTIGSLTLHSYLTAGYNYQISDNLKLTPSVIFKTDTKLANTSFDINTNLHIKGKHWIGLSYRRQEALVAMLGTSFLKNNSLKVGYAFDYVTNFTKAKASTSHEIMLSFVIPPSLSITKPILRTPRYRYN